MKRAWLFSSKLLVAVVSWTRIIFGAINKEHCQFKERFCFCSNEMQQSRIWRAKTRDEFTTT
jgi:hypothetical protein